MQDRWYRHLKDPEQRDLFKKRVRGSKDILDRLLEILKEMEEELTLKELNQSMYDSPSWAAKQADINGDRRRIRIFQKLLTLTKEKPDA